MKGKIKGKSKGKGKGKIKGKSKGKTPGLRLTHCRNDACLAPTVVPPSSFLLPTSYFLLRVRFTRTGRPFFSADSHAASVNWITRKPHTGGT